MNSPAAQVGTRKEPGKREAEGACVGDWLQSSGTLVRVEVARPGMHWASLRGIIPAPEAGKPDKSEGGAIVRVQIYTNDREQPIDLEVLEMRTRAREISTNENGQQKEPSVDQTVREVIKDPAMGASANLLFTAPDGKEGAIYLNTQKVAAVVTSWSSAHNQAE